MQKLTPELFEQIARGAFTWFDFQIDQHNREAIELICQWANNDPQFEKDGRCLGKGLLLFGNPGSGKTKLMEVLQIALQYTKSDLAYSKTQIWKEARDYKQAGDGIFNKFMKGHWFFDELRRKKDEELVTYYGNRVDVGRDVIYNAYERFVGFSQFMTHFTTNNTRDELRQTFDDEIELPNGMQQSRSYSRLTEMCNFITIVTPFDRRETAMPRRKTVFVEEITPEEEDQRNKQTTHGLLTMIAEDYHKWEKADNREAFMHVRLPNMYYDTLEKLGAISLTPTRKKELMDKANTNIRHTIEAPTGRLYELKHLLTDIAQNPMHTKVVSLAKLYAVLDFFSIVHAGSETIEQTLQLSVKE